MAHRGHIQHAVAHTIIPEEVWNSRDFLYVGLEVYIAHAGEGKENDWVFTNTLVDLILGCNDTDTTGAIRYGVQRALKSIKNVYY